jgi:hypothetical protein
MNNPEESLIVTKSPTKPNLSLVDEYKVFEEIQRAQNFASLIESRRSSMKKRDITHNLSNNPDMKD